MIIIDKALRKCLKKYLPKNYRKVIVDRLAKQNKTYHPNTIRNVLNGSPNPDVARELIALYEEHKKVADDFNGIANTIISEAKKPTSETMQAS